MRQAVGHLRLIIMAIAFKALSDFLYDDLVDKISFSLHQSYMKDIMTEMEEHIGCPVERAFINNPENPFATLVNKYNAKCYVHDVNRLIILLPHNRIFIWWYFETDDDQFCFMVDAFYQGNVVQFERVYCDSIENNSSILAYNLTSLVESGTSRTKSYFQQLLLAHHRIDCPITYNAEVFESFDAYVTAYMTYYNSKYNYDYVYDSNKRWSNPENLYNFFGNISITQTWNRFSRYISGEVPQIEPDENSEEIDYDNEL